MQLPCVYLILIKKYIIKWIKYSWTHVQENNISSVVD
jgi:hypothetical protein